MAQPAPRMMMAPEMKRSEVPMTAAGEAGPARGAANKVLKRQGKKR